jgi:hypothetical protein
MKMKVLTLLLVAFFNLQAIACAVPYNATIGPYTVSFDMDFSNYYLTTEPWKATESLNGAEKYEVGSVNVYKDRDHADGVAIISIKHNDKDQSYLSPSASAKGFGEVSDTAAVRTMDGVSGVIASLNLGNGITIYTAQYHPLFDPKRLNVTIVSNYPWDEGTLPLLKTIHIEKPKKNTTYNRTVEQTTSSSNPFFKILIEEENDQVITTSSPLKLAEDYVLKINHIDVDGNKVYLDLLKGDKVVDSKIVSPSSDNPTEEDKIYHYKKDIGNSKNATLIEIHFKNAFRGSDQDLATISSVLQISENPSSP